MRFNLVDRITEVVSGKSLRGKKFLTLGEEYLADHFPGFPIMPGVLQLQALVEVSSWLWRVTSEFQHSVVVLREVRGVKYGSFVEPGRCLDLHTELVRINEGDFAVFKAKGTVDGTQTVAAQLTLCAYNIPDHSPSVPLTNAALIAGLRQKYEWLIGVRA